MSAPSSPPISHPEGNPHEEREPPGLSVAAAASTTNPAPVRPRALTRIRTGLFGALARHEIFRRLWFGSLAASTGQWMQQVALGWLALTLTNSAYFVGLVTFAAGVPFLIVAPLGGSLIDRYDRRQLLLICQAIAGVIAVLIAVVVLTGIVQPWHLIVAAIANGSLLAMMNPTQQSMVPGLVPRDDLTNAIGLMSAGQNMTRIAGPSIAGAIIGWVGVGPTFLLQAVAMMGAFALVFRVNVPRHPARAPGARGVFDGIRLIARRTDLRRIFLLACVPTFFVFPYVHFLNVLARDILEIGAGGLGVLMAASGFGAVVGSLVVATRGQMLIDGGRLAKAIVVYGAVIVAVSASRAVALSLPLLFCSGFIGAGVMSANNAAMQHRIDDDIRGRVMGVYLLTWGLMPLGAMPMGLAADRLSVPIAMTIGAVISSSLAAVIAFRTPMAASD